MDSVSGSIPLRIALISFFKKILADTCPFLGPLVPQFWISTNFSSEFQIQSGFCLICFFAEANVMYIAQDPHLMPHMLTNWRPAVQSVTSPYASAEVGLGLDSNGQSPGQETNVPNTVPAMDCLTYINKMIWLANLVGKTVWLAFQMSAFPVITFLKIWTITSNYKKKWTK